MTEGWQGMPALALQSLQAIGFILDCSIIHLTSDGGGCYCCDYC